ncbi:MAG: hypothetical protein B7X04_01550 [Parcubacteria group bacterium 21-54-25]|nr:MAG: hypothetical protein B7X04_01550 [Parcubacteria group bacterium 21-54-25]
MLGILSFFVVQASAGVCPPIGNDSGCGVVINVTNTGGALSFNQNQGPYDGIDDTLVGITNNSSQSLHDIGLASTNSIFGFDFDGIDAYGSQGNPSDANGYGGPNAYYSHINATQTSGTVNFVSPIPPGGVGYFSLENALTAPTPCQQIVNNAVSGPILGGRLGSFLAEPTDIGSSFTPNLGLGLSQAAADCGFTNFDWVQTITNEPDPSPFYAVNAQDPSSPIHMTNARTPFNDPPPGGYTYCLPSFGYTCNDAPFYYSVTAPSTNGFALQNHETTNVLSFFDAPKDPCLGIQGLLLAECDYSMAPIGSKEAFTTDLAGVLPDGSALDLGIGFSWTDDFNDISGGIATTLNNMPVDPGSGTGGITVTHIQPTTDYQFQLPPVTVTTVNGVPTVAEPPTLCLVALGLLLMWGMSTAHLRHQRLRSSQTALWPRHSGSDRQC